MYLVTREMLNNLKDMFSSLMAEMLKIKIGILVFVLLLIICAVYFVEKMKGE